MRFFAKALPMAAAIGLAAAPVGAHAQTASSLSVARAGAPMTEADGQVGGGSIVPAILLVAILGFSTYLVIDNEDDDNAVSP